MKRKHVILTVLFTLGMLASCAGNQDLAAQQNAASKNAGACAAAYNPSSVYVAGDKASENGTNYQANWWTQGSDPNGNSGPTGSGLPWQILGTCSASGNPSNPNNPNSTDPNNVTAGPATPATFLFSPYKDVTISANWNTEVISTAVNGSTQAMTDAMGSLNAATWAFATGECGAETWGGIGGAQLASANVSAWSSAKKNYVLSTGGAAGVFTCGSDPGFSTFIDRYASANLVGIDFDIEGGQSQADIDALVARVKAAQANPKYANLRFSFTIATLGGNAPQSLGQTGVMVMNAIKSGGLSNYLVNLMTMDYGSPTAANCTLNGSTCDMAQSAIQAAKNLNSAYNVPFTQIELTPMIGGNDTQGETFSLDDVVTLSQFATANKLAGVHHWSFDRDKDCAPGSASPTCNSFGQAGTLGFTAAFLKAL